MSSENLIRDDLTIPAGTTIKFRGMPFVLMTDIEVQGLEVNLEYAKNYDSLPKTGENPLSSSHPVGRLIGHIQPS